jgi:hypothetical protein
LNFHDLANKQGLKVIRVHRSFVVFTRHGQKGKKGAGYIIYEALNKSVSFASFEYPGLSLAVPRPAEDVRGV